ncbi:MAG TPA: fumarylacetoacetate hydrolase family protein [Candidatus Acidoferrum sp.]|nr:fumarylacetoacetate hydrolase family protein [Candidatus Acidoferrum sp.]
MKLYNLPIGIMVKYDGEARLVTNTDWDNFVNDDNLYDKLLKWLPMLPKVANVDTLLKGPLLPPMQGQELWASGVTYLRSKQERQLESKEAGGGDFYQRVYEAERPELFFKANRERVTGHGGRVRIRRDSTWNVPEPELALMVTKHGKIVGYTIGNDMSSRSIEGENPLYLPQAKTYDGCAALGPCLYVTDKPFPLDSHIRIVITRAEQEVFSGDVTVDKIQRRFEDLVEYLLRECSFPRGVLLLTGTGIVPGADFTLQSGDKLSISIDHIGTLESNVA